MKRYDLLQVNACYTSDHEMEPADDGEWVRYEEVSGIIAGYEQRLSLIHWWSEKATGPQHVGAGVTDTPPPQFATDEQFAESSQRVFKKHRASLEKLGAADTGRPAPRQEDKLDKKEDSV